MTPLPLSLLAARFRRPSAPLKMTLALTSRCNLRCAICRQWAKPAEIELDCGELDRLFADVGELRWLSLTGGEVFLRDDIADIARTIAGRCSRLLALSIPTNGWETDRIATAVETMAGLFPRRLFLTVSIDGPKELHDRLRGRAGSWDRAVATYTRLKRIPGVAVYASMTLSVHNLDAVEETLSALRRAVPAFEARRDMNFNVAHVSPHYYDNEGLPAPDAGSLADALHAAQAALRRGFSGKGFLQDCYLRYYRQYLATGRPPLPCRALRLSCFVSARGELFPCHACGPALGGLRDADYDLKALWNAPQTREAARRCAAGECPGCWSPCEAYPAIVGAMPETAFAYFFATI